MNTVRKLSKSVPRHLSLVLGSTCRNVHAVVLPRLPYAHYADAFVLSRRPLRWGLRVRLPFTPLPAVRCRPPLRTPWVDASEMSSSRRRTSAAPIPASWPATATVPSPRHTPTSSEYEKREAFPPPLGVLFLRFQPGHNGFERRGIQRFRGLSHREIGEANALGVSVLGLYHSTSASRGGDFGRLRVAVRDRPQHGFRRLPRSHTKRETNNAVIPDVRRNGIGGRLLREQHHAPSGRAPLADDGRDSTLATFDKGFVFLRPSRGVEERLTFINDHEVERMERRRTTVPKVGVGIAPRMGFQIFNATLCQLFQLVSRRLQIEVTFIVVE